MPKDLTWSFSEIIRLWENNFIVGSGVSIDCDLASFQSLLHRQLQMAPIVVFGLWNNRFDSYLSERQ